MESRWTTGVSDCERNGQLRNTSSLYRSSTRVDQVTRAVGPLYFAHVDVEGTLVDCMIDLGSSATIISFDLSKEIRGKARISSSELKMPDVTLRDYSHNPIPIGAQVSLTFKWRDRSVTTPVYVRSDIATEGESCLLGTNVDIPLGLMVPDRGLKQEVGQPYLRVHLELRECV